MTTPASPDHAEPWYLLGAGNMGLLAAHYLQRAGLTVIALRRDDAPTLERTLLLPSGDRVSVQLLCERAPPAKGAKPRQDPRARSNDSTNNVSGIPPAGSAGLSRAGPAPTRPAPIQRLVVACKAPFSAAALGGLPLAADATVLRLQNGLGSLDGLLPAGARRVEVVSASAVKRDGDAHRVVAENDTWMGESAAPGGPAAAEPPAWFGPLARHWPKLHWPDDFRHRQWRKLVGNAVINPLTGLHDVANGHIFQDPALAAEAEQLAREADRVLTALDPTWPGDSLPGVRALADATAGNTSSMRADMQAGAVTEIDAINGWLLRQADVLGLDLPAHRRLVAAVKARHP
ncbi:MAG: ketopantoate reductase C-terminal domain-containing protein [Alloalcanivorax venustensis]|uniref:ketopantoate reductase family protein n=1 Tax=Alloalcanivorax venustensis TaxID=172371 RepID=UPI003002DF61